MNTVHFPTKICDTPDLSGLYQFEFETCTGLSLRCYLEYEEAEDGHGDHPDTTESMDLLYAFIGLIDIAGSELVSDELKEKIEAGALQRMAKDHERDEYDRGEDRYLDRMAA